MIVADASVIVPMLAGHDDAKRLRTLLIETGERMCAPELLDLEVANVLRRFERLKTMERQQAQEAIDALLLLPMTRYPHHILLPRIWQLRGHITAYDAAYVALAEGVRGTLFTRDARLKEAVAGLGVAVEVV
jgi:predicted nucleic acid-binding protein